MERQPLDPQNHRVQRVGLHYTGCHGEYQAPDRFDSRTVITDYTRHNRGVNIYIHLRGCLPSVPSHVSQLYVDCRIARFCRITCFNKFKYRFF